MTIEPALQVMGLAFNHPRNAFAREGLANTRDFGMFSDKEIIGIEKLLQKLIKRAALHDELISSEPAFIFG